MSVIDIAEAFNALIFRRRYGSGFKPHFSIRIEGVDFHIDSSPGKGYNLITHAHSDHFGQSNMKNFKAIASQETSAILSAVSGESFRGIAHKLNDRIDAGGVRIRSYPTFHIFGSTAYHFNSHGILITGDVKDFSKLPACEFLVTEATYGSPSHIFEDDLERVLVEAKAGNELGVYPVGKAQRIAKFLAENGVGFKTTEKIRRICNALEIEFDHGEAELLPPKMVRNGYVLSAQKFYKRRITVSDHLDYRGLIEMIEHCNPDYVLFYHGKPSRKLVDEIRKSGRKAFTLSEIDLYL